MVDMDQPHPLKRAIELAGITALGRACGVSHQAVRKWEATGRMPRTEWTGETHYATAIARLCDGQVTREQLLAPWPKVDPAAGAGATQQEPQPHAA